MAFIFLPSSGQRQSRQFMDRMGDGFCNEGFVREVMRDLSIHQEVTTLLGDPNMYVSNDQEFQGSTELSASYTESGSLTSSENPSFEKEDLCGLLTADLTFSLLDEVIEEDLRSGEMESLHYQQDIPIEEKDCGKPPSPMWGGGNQFCPQNRYIEHLCTADEADLSPQSTYMSSTQKEDSGYSDSSSSSLESYYRGDWTIKKEPVCLESYYRSDWTIKKEPVSSLDMVKHNLGYPGLCHGTFNDHQDTCDSYRRDSMSSDCDSRIEDECSSATCSHIDKQLYMPPVKQSQRRTSSRRRRGNSSEKPKRKGKQLWQFLLDVLKDDRYNPDLIRWVDKEKGVFKFVQSQQVAKLWGQKRQRDTMTYEYMSRAMRHYYRRGIMLRVKGKRLVYQFTSDDWKNYIWWCVKSE